MSERTPADVLAGALQEASERWTLDLPRDFSGAKSGAVEVILAYFEAADWILVRKQATGKAEPPTPWKGEGES